MEDNLVELGSSSFRDEKVCPYDQYWIRCIELGLMKEWPGESHYLKEKRQFAKKKTGESLNVWKKTLWTDETKIGLLVHQRKDITSVANKIQCFSSQWKYHLHCEAWHVATFMQWQCLLISRDWITGQSSRKKEWSKRQKNSLEELRVFQRFGTRMEVHLSTEQRP